MSGSSFVADLTGGLIGETSGERGARRAARELQAGSAEAQETILGATAPFRALGEAAIPQLQGAVLEGDLLPPEVFMRGEVSPEDIIGDPFFGALAEEQDRSLLASAAARGRVGAGGTGDALIRQRLLLGSRFRELERGNLQTQFQNRFTGEQAQFQNRLAANQQRFGQLFGITGLGANVSVGAGTQIANLQTGAASAGAAGTIGQAQARRQGVQDLVEIATLGLAGGGGFGGGGGVPINQPLANATGTITPRF